MGTELLTIDEQVTHAESKTYKSYPFEVPAGTIALNLDFQVEPRRVGPYEQAVKVVVFGPDGLRGTPGRGALPARLTQTSATLGFTVGPLLPGAWTAEISLEHVLDGPPCMYHLRLWAETDENGYSAEQDVPRPSIHDLPAAIPDTGMRWYAGDLHMHTHQSDGQWSPAELLRAVQERGLEYFVLTDHNIQWALPEIAALGAGVILPIPGVEVSTLAGHLLAIGVEQWIEWRVGWQNRSINDIVRDVHAAGGLAIIAHPGAIGSPDCHGCKWELGDVDPAQVDAVEIWNGPWADEAEQNERGVRFWQGWLARGYRTPFTGGSDAHGGLPSFARGAPTTYVYARDLSRAAILEGLRAGRIVVSSGPELRLTGAMGEMSCGPGETLSGSGVLALVATVSKLSGAAYLRIIGNGTLLAEQTLTGDVEFPYSLEQPRPGWYLAEVRSHDTGEMLAITNPLWLVDGAAT